KGLHVLIEAARRLRGDFDVRIFGDPSVAPDYTRDLERMAEGLPVRFEGAFDRATAAAVYRGIDVLVVPSLWPENAPLVLQEASLHGVPVVAARVGGIPEFVTDGVNGLLYDATSANELAAALQDLAADIVVVDSGSRDGTVEHARGRGATVIEIAPGTFNHGATRNLGIARAAGALVVLLVQDAVPASSGWLRALTAPFAMDPAVAGTFGRQIPWPAARSLARWSGRDWIAAGSIARVSGPLSAGEFDRLSPDERHRACVFDNVCSCVRRDIWSRHPFRETPIAED